VCLTSNSFLSRPRWRIVKSLKFASRFPARQCSARRSAPAWPLCHGDLFIYHSNSLSNNFPAIFFPITYLTKRQNRAIVQIYGDVNEPFIWNWVSHVVPELKSERKGNLPFRSKVAYVIWINVALAKTSLNTADFFTTFNAKKSNITNELAIFFAIISSWEKFFSFPPRKLATLIKSRTPHQNLPPLPVCLAYPETTTNRAGANPTTHCFTPLHSSSLQNLLRGLSLISHFPPPLSELKEPSKKFKISAPKSSDFIFYLLRCTLTSKGLERSLEHVTHAVV